MDTLQAINALSDIGLSAVLLVLMWQGLKRFDRLLTLVILLAARSQLTQAEIDKLTAQTGITEVNGKNRG